MYMIIYIKLLDGTKHPYEVSESNTIAYVKTQIEQYMNIIGGIAACGRRSSGQ